jgi:hypothetical protein
VNGPELDGPPPARRTDPGTSWAAARRLDTGRRITQAELALSVIAAAGPRGATCADVVRKVGGDRGCVARRITDAAAWGWVRTEGDTRKAPSGRRQRVWHVTASGLQRAADVLARRAEGAA